MKIFWKQAIQKFPATESSLRNKWWKRNCFNWQTREQKDWECVHKELLETEPQSLVQTYSIGGPWAQSGFLTTSAWPFNHLYTWKASINYQSSINKSSILYVSSTWHTELVSNVIVRCLFQHLKNPVFSRLWQPPVEEWVDREVPVYLTTE